MVRTEGISPGATLRRAEPTALAREAGAPALQRLAFSAMGTMCEVQYATDDGQASAAFAKAVLSWVQGFEARYSRFRPNSLISRINAAAGRAWVQVDQEMEDMFLVCDNLHTLTRGVLDPTALPLISLWNWRAPAAALPTPARIDAARRLTGWQKVQRAPGRVFLPEPGMALDFGGFGKEYAVDLVACIAANHGIPAVLVDFGHDIFASGQPPGRPAWHIGLEDPRNPGHTAGSMAITNRGVASSGDYVRRFVFEGKRYGHIIDPRTGWPVDNGCAQATVVAASCLQAGGLSTAAFVLGMKEGIEFIRSCRGAEGIIWHQDRRAQTPGFSHYETTA